MEGDIFAERLAGVRKRFAAKLPVRIAEIDAALPELAGEGGQVAAAVYTVHRKVHDLCGIGPTLGFLATGQAARICEKILLQPSRGERGLTEQELARLQEGLVALRAAAHNDMQSTHTVPE
jgi:chemotaxis protein histidine kinase CheA